MTWINHSSTFLLNRLSIFYIIFSVDLEFLLLWIGCHIYWRHLTLVRSLIPKSGFRSRAVRFRAPSLGVVGKMSLLFLILWMLIRPDNRLFASRPLCGAVRRRINHLSGFAVHVIAARLFGDLWFAVVKPPLPWRHPPLAMRRNLSGRNLETQRNSQIRRRNFRFSFASSLAFKFSIISSSEDPQN